MKPIKFFFEDIKYELPLSATQFKNVRLPDGRMLEGKWRKCKDCDIPVFADVGLTSEYGFPFILKYTNAEMAYQSHLA